MAVEIELKAWVDDPEGLRERLSGLGEFCDSFDKEDVYWFPPGARPGLASGVRIRRSRRTEDPRHDWEGGGGLPETTRVTYKVKEVRDRVEINDEREFEVSSGAAFEELLERLGLAPGISKGKRGWLWRRGAMRVELALVRGLGWFIELEILAGDALPATVAEARRLLLDFLERSGIGADRIETRYYTEMLREKGE